VQSWFARVHENQARQAQVYRLFALSNLASLFALMAYPVLEPFATLGVQSYGWSAGFLLFAGLVVASAWRTERAVRLHGSAQVDERTQPTGAAAPPPRLGDYALWLALAALGTVMLLTVTTHITQDVASVPFLWILPLALYLLTFVLCFDSNFWYRRWLFWPAVMILAPLMTWALREGNGVLPVSRAIPIFCGGLFAVCMFCHGELVRARPAPAWLTRFYLMISLGGALGGLFVGVLAPRVFSGAWEFPMALAAASLLLWRVVHTGAASARLGLLGFSALLLLGFGYFIAGYLRLPVSKALPLVVALGLVVAALVAWRQHSVRAGANLAALLSVGCCAWLGWIYVDFIGSDAVVAQRNFYGVLRVKEYEKPGDPDHARVLMHGVISHGLQYTHDSLRRRPTSYYGETSGVGLAISKLRTPDHPQRIGGIGLGAGTLAAYGAPGGTIRYYEINPAVMSIAARDFTYLADSASTVRTVLGDARLSLENEAAAGQLQEFDVLVVDAFSSDSIPVHLMTREAMAIYLQHIRPDGVIAFHVSNRFLNLAPVVAQLAEDARMRAILIDDAPSKDDYWLKTTDYVLVTRNKAFLDDPVVKARGQAIEPVPGLKLWTDDYNNLFKILK
jgi:hypothetical protein